MSNLKILAIGDICGENSVEYLRARLSALVKYEGVGFVVANGENAALNGITPELFEAIRLSGIDVVTGGNHSMYRREIYPVMDDSPYIIRPVNYPISVGNNPPIPGYGSTIITTPYGKILVINAQGRVHIEPQLDDPFAAIEDVLTHYEGEYDISILDFHAEATSEKFAMGYCFDGKITIVYGTHTHVPTADEIILPGGTGYITDIGMTGPLHSALGVDPEIILRRLRTGMPVRHIPAKTEIHAQGAIFEIENKKCINIYRVEF